MMARSRTIKPGFFTNEELAECSLYARLLFSALWCLSDREGRIEDRPKRIKTEALPYDAVDCDKLLEELQSKKFIVRYESDGVKCIQVLNFRKHQTPHPKEAKSTLPALSREKVCPSNVISVAGNVISETSKGSVGRGLEECKKEECKEEECKEEEKQETREEEVSAHRLDPNFDDRVNELWPEVQQIHSDARPNIKPPILNGVRKRAMSNALDDFTREQILETWRWAMTAPDFIAESIRGARGIDTLLQPDKIAGYIESAADPSRWKKQVRAGPEEADPVAAYFEQSIAKEKAKATK